MIQFYPIFSTTNTITKKVQLLRRERITEQHTREYYCLSITGSLFLLLGKKTLVWHLGKFLESHYLHYYIWIHYYSWKFPFERKKKYYSWTLSTRFPSGSFKEKYKYSYYIWESSSRITALLQLTNKFNAVKQINIDSSWLCLVPLSFYLISS